MKELISGAKFRDEAALVLFPAKTTVLTILNPHTPRARLEPELNLLLLLLLLLLLFQSSTILRWNNIDSGEMFDNKKYNQKLPRF